MISPARGILPSSFLEKIRLPSTQTPSDPGEPIWQLNTGPHNEREIAYPRVFEVAIMQSAAIESAHQDTFTKNNSALQA